MKPYVVTKLKLVWNPMQVMSLLVLEIDILQDNMSLLLVVLDPLKKFEYLIQEDIGGHTPIPIGSSWNFSILVVFS
jgi:hypothetical protein